MTNPLNPLDYEQQHIEQLGFETLERSLKPVAHELNELDWKTSQSDKTERFAQHLSAFSQQFWVKKKWLRYREFYGMCGIIFRTVIKEIRKMKSTVRSVGQEKKGC